MAKHDDFAIAAGESGMELPNPIGRRFQG